MRYLALVFSFGVLTACTEKVPPPLELDAAIRLDAPPAPLDGGAFCRSNAECNDSFYCTGVEVCDPGAPDADAFGCVSGAPPCPDVCDEGLERCPTPCELEGDMDGDGHLSPECGGDDCNDRDASIHPSALELCDEAGVDEDCDPLTVGERDEDADGVVDTACCNGTRCGGDCDDASPTVHPGAAEACNDVDDDCDTHVDEDLAIFAYYVDADGDGAGARGSAAVRDCAQPEGYVRSSEDCDDTSPDVAPGAAERCNGVDDDCDGTVDELVGNRFYRDADGDGWGDSDVGVSMEACEAPTGYVGRRGDCDDTRASTHPMAAESCNRVDDDCSSVADPGGEDLREDADLDGHAPLGAACEGGFPKDDCDDTRADVHPDATELCSGRDEDCDTRTDEGTTSFCGRACGVSCAGTAPTFDMHDEAVCAIDAGVPHCWGRAAAVTGHPNLALRTGPLEESSPVALPLSGAVALSSSDDFACVVLSDGTMRCWGDNSFGTLGVGDQEAHAVPVTPLGVVDAVGVATSTGAVCALHASGDVSCWGNNAYAQLGRGTGFSFSSTPMRVPSIDGAVELVGAGNNFCARTLEGALWCWGYEPIDAVRGSGGPRLALEGVRDVASGGLTRHLVCARRDDGWWCWGYDLAVEVGGSLTLREPTRAPLLDGAVDVAIANRFACAVAADRSVSCWGSADMLDGEGVVGRSFPTPVASDLPPADEIACTSSGCCVRHAGTFECRGYPDTLVFGDGEPRVRGPMPAREFAGMRWMTFFGESSSACLLESDERLRCVGRPHVIAWESGATAFLSPRDLLGPDAPVAQADGDATFFCLRTTSGEAWCGTGRAAPGDGSVSPTSDLRRVDASSMGAVRSLAVGEQFACAIAASDDRVWCWGATDDFSSPMCGDGDATMRCVRPVPVVGDRAFRVIDATTQRVCGVTHAGALWCWGRMGAGLLSVAHEPVEIGGFSDIDDVAMGRSHTCVRRAGRVQCVGNGFDGQLGHGVTGRSDSFVDVLGIDDAVGLSCRADTCFARRPDDSYVGWGRDGGRIGGAVRVIDQLVPVPAAHGHRGELFLGRSSACLLRADGEVVCWGIEGDWEVRGLPLHSTRPTF
ncbi:MAG: MopE-related protein [Polyangiales bacterium]|nr:hypothetical protein [Myxococcales bacterium]